MEAIVFTAFRPDLQGIFAQRFYETSKGLSDRQPGVEEFEDVVAQEINWCVNGIQINAHQRRIYRASWLLFRDLVRAGWVYRWRSGRLEIAPPQFANSSGNPDEIRAIKTTMRRSMNAARSEKLHEAQEFIARVENPSSSSVAKVPITELIANGTQLGRSLQEIAAIKGANEKIKRLEDIIQPYIQLTEEGKRCDLTGHKLSDIWRYFRLTWSNPADFTPGRSMSYLIRDAAQPLHPIIGIASLENTALRIKERDDFIGWTPEAFVEKLTNLPNTMLVRSEFEELLSYVEIGLRDIDPEGLCTLEEIADPDRAVIERLKYIALESKEARTEALVEWRNLSDESDEEEIALERSQLGKISLAAEKALYRRKRSEQLHRLLAAKLSIHALLENKDFDLHWRQYVQSDTGYSVIRAILLSIKNRHIGTSMLELNVCGAIPPYNEILGGKLVTLLMLSPQIVQDYRDRYGERPSDIASRMKGEPVVRPAELVYLGTTSLYSVGSSQYNRLKLPANLMKENGLEVRWQKLGLTKGYGSLHISRQTLQALTEVSEDAFINNVFGEGTSPKLRLIRHAVENILESEKKRTAIEFVKHSMSRIIYGACLASNSREYLMGLTDTPEYYFDEDQLPDSQTEIIVDYWRKRWLLSRINYKPALDRMIEFEPQNIYLGSETLDGQAIEHSPIFEEVSMTANELVPDDWRGFVQRLYRDTSAYADNMPIDVLKDWHVETRLDNAVLDALEQKKSVILTGNPGDGKTHLLRILEPKLENLSTEVIIELDASAIPNDELMRKWENAVTQEKPFCVAINVAVLIDLAESYPNFRAVQVARNQLETAVGYGREEQELDDFPLVVFDLSRRNVLNSDIVARVIDKLTNPDRLVPCEGCPGCDMIRNQRILRDPLVQERLQAVMDRVSRRGYHATLRELQAFFSFLIFGGRTCNELIQQSSAYEYSFPMLPYLGKGRLFDEISETFDPKNISYPTWDEVLLSSVSSENWITDWYDENQSITPENTARFTVRKRAFYYCHDSGKCLLDIADDDETKFADFLSMSQRDALRFVIKGINSFFGDSDQADSLRVWQSHRFNQDSRRILYSASKTDRLNLEVVHPQLDDRMKTAFDLALDHVIIRLRTRKEARLRVNFALFELLAQAQRGVPVYLLDNELTRRIWQFMEQLSIDSPRDELDVILLNPESGEILTVRLDVLERRYLSIM